MMQESFGKAYSRRATNRSLLYVHQGLGLTSELHFDAKGVNVDIGRSEELELNVGIKYLKHVPLKAATSEANREED
jgi:hypothetical protein